MYTKYFYLFIFCLSFASLPAFPSAFLLFFNFYLFKYYIYQDIRFNNLIFLHFQFLLTIFCGKLVFVTVSVTNAAMLRLYDSHGYYQSCCIFCWNFPICSQFAILILAYRLTIIVQFACTCLLESECGYNCWLAALLLHDRMNINLCIIENGVV